MSERRKFIKKISALAAVSMTQAYIYGNVDNTSRFLEIVERIFPKRLKKGAIIGLVAPGGPILKEQLNRTIEKIEDLGFKAYYTDMILSEYGYFAGNDQERAKDLMSMFINKNVDAILAIRGGYGSVRILDLLDYKLIRENPKMLIGYSDVTALINAIYQQTGLVGFHGPVGISTFNEFAIDSMEKVLMRPKNSYKFPYQREEDTDANPEYDLYTLNGGEAEGVLVGGNLSVIESMIGTRHEIDFENKIVYLEEINEKTYKVDKLLTHLVQGTNIDKASGIAMGVFKKCNMGDEPRLTLMQVINDIIKPLNIPTVYGLPFGHIANKITIPTGIKAELDADKMTLKLLEKAVS